MHSMFVRALNIDYYTEIDVLVHNGNKEEWVWNTWDTLKFLLVQPCPSKNSME